MLLSLTMILLTSFMMTSYHPISILIMILTQTLLICFFIWNYVSSSWFAFILFLIFLGGLMILFIYIVSLASNEKFTFNIKNWIPQAIMIFSISLMFFNEKISSTWWFKINDLSLIFSKNMIWLTMMIMTYLLITLFVAVKVSSKTEGPIRSILN